MSSILQQFIDDGILCDEILDVQSLAICLSSLDGGAKQSLQTAALLKLACLSTTDTNLETLAQYADCLNEDKSNFQLAALMLLVCNGIAGGGGGGGGSDTNFVFGSGTIEAGQSTGTINWTGGPLSGVPTDVQYSPFYVEGDGIVSVGGYVVDATGVDLELSSSVHNGVTINIMGVLA